MRYQGGKARQAVAIARVVAEQPVGRYIEPFLGGASVACAVAGSGCAGMLDLSDALSDLVLLWKAGLDGWVPPAFLTREEYATLRDGPASALRAWAGIAASHSGKWFGGYGVACSSAGRDYLAEAQRGFVRKCRSLSSVNVVVSDAAYEDVDVRPGDCVYADPPYANSTGYDGTDPFDSGRFWRTMEAWTASGARVLVSEFDAPEGWCPVLRYSRSATLDPASSKTREEILWEMPA